MSDLFLHDYVNKIVVLEERIGAYIAYKPMEPFWSPGKGFKDPLRLQGAAKEIADFIGLAQYTFVITVVKQKPKTAGKIELKYSGDEVFVEISQDVQDFEDATIATLAHELTHKYMQVNGISLGTNSVGIYEDEVFTDITAILLGLGKFLLNGCNNERTSQECRGIDTYDITRTMTVGYLTQKQMAFVYRLICSMRGLSRNDMLSNLNRKAQDAVLDCDCYTDDYFNLDFTSEDYRKTVADTTINQLFELQNRLDEFDKAIDFTTSQLAQLKNALEMIKAKAFDVRSQLEHAIRSSSYDPCMRFLEHVRLKQWKTMTASTISKMHEETDNLHTPVTRLRRAAEKATTTTEKNRTRRYIAILAIIAAILLLLVFAYAQLNKVL